MCIIVSLMRHIYCWNLHVLRSLISREDPTLIRDDESRRSRGVRRLGAMRCRDWMGMKRPLTCSLKERDKSSWVEGVKCCGVVCACGGTGVAEPLKVCSRRTCLLF
jgi:hypothetical protein